ncbi:UDP-galactose-lipid carrier transferase [Rhodospirillaceae bacterium LM-1]|nr:UDP-galactose-lipid carrier transferase [Rhodospirillaceae bacterium LM-1]
MFQTAELGQKVSREDFDRISQDLRTDLLTLQNELRGCDFPVILVFAGVDGGGKGETVNLLNEWMDPRWIATRAYSMPSDEERERPFYWRFWRDLPPKGQVGLFLSSWYSHPINSHVRKEASTAEFESLLDRVNSFEKTLADDGALIVKFWLHLSKSAQKRRLKSLEKDELQSWRVTKQDWKNWKNYDQFINTAEHMISKTSTGYAPWEIVEGEDSRFRSLTVLTLVRDAIRKHMTERATKRKVIAELAAAANAKRTAELANVHSQIKTLEKKAEAATTKKAGKGKAKAAKAQETPTASLTPQGQLQPRTVLSALDMTQKYEKKEAGLALKKAKAELALLYRQAKARGISTLLVFEGWDAAGKGGAIRRLTASLDARDYRVTPVAAPTDEERAQHYLWRFWRHMPRAGRLTIFDRSWYGRVLVERVEGFARNEEWHRAFSEINDFEEQIAFHGTVLAKFWVHITKEEQYRRFKERETIAYKKWKLTDEDWRNRAKWDDYEIAVNEMVERTSTRQAPWILVEGNDKNFARVKIIQSVADLLKKRLAK